MAVVFVVLVAAAAFLAGAFAAVFFAAAAVVVLRALDVAATARVLAASTLTVMPSPLMWTRSAFR